MTSEGSGEGMEQENGYGRRAEIGGLVGNFFSRERSGAPRFAPGPLTLAHLLLFHRRLDGDMATTRALVAVKIRCQSEQT